jgi:urease accessory protein
MSTDDGVLSLLQLSDSFFPLGGYALSFGLEAFSQVGLLKNQAQVAALVETFVEQLATLECPAMRGAYSAAKRSDPKVLASIDRTLASFKNVKEFYEASRRTGRAILRTVDSFTPSSTLSQYLERIERNEAPGTYPVCLALASWHLGIDEERAVTLMLYTSVISVLGAAIRLGHLTHLEAQQILQALKQPLRAAAKRSASIPWRFMRAFAPTLDIMGMRHAYLSSRMFFC